VDLCFSHAFQVLNFIIENILKLREIRFWETFRPEIPFFKDFQNLSTEIKNPDFVRLPDYLQNPTFIRLSGPPLGPETKQKVFI
jgi:hypothetical protein